MWLLAVTCGGVAVGLAVAALPPAAPLMSTASGPAHLCHGKVATLVGTPEDDSFVRPRASVIVTLGGDDKVYEPRKKDVVVCGDSGRDELDAGDEGGGLYDGGSGRDVVGSLTDVDFQTGERLTLFGGPGKDELYGGFGKDTIKGGDGRDLVYGNWNDDRIKGGRGGDRLFGSPGDDRLFGNRGQDRLKGYRGHDLADGGPNEDRCEAEVKRRCES